MNCFCLIEFCLKVDFIVIMGFMIDVICLILDWVFSEGYFSEDD